MSTDHRQNCEESVLTSEVSNESFVPGNGHSHVHVARPELENTVAFLAASGLDRASYMYKVANIYKCS